MRTPHYAGHICINDVLIRGVREVSIVLYEDYCGWSMFLSAHYVVVITNNISLDYCYSNPLAVTTYTLYQQPVL